MAQIPLTFSTIYTEIQDLRFSSAIQSKIKRWVQLSEMKVWTAAEWPFRYVRNYSLAVVANNNNPTLPSDFARVMKKGLQDDLGRLLTYLDPDSFEAIYTGSANVYTGRPQEYTLVNGALYLGPKPDANYTFSLSYERQLCHYDTNANVVTGPMSVDTDYPIFNANFHYILVPCAMSHGLVLENDPSSQAVQQEYGMILVQMMDFYLPPDRPETSQYGADTIGYEFW